MDLNTAGVETVAKVVGLSKAYDLVLWRPYLSWEELAELPGFSREELDALRAAGAQIKLPGDPWTMRDERNLPRDGGFGA